LVQRRGDWASCGHAHPFLAVPNITAQSSMVSVPTSYYLTWHYNCFWRLKG